MQPLIEFQQIEILIFILIVGKNRVSSRLGTPETQ